MDLAIIPECYTDTNLIETLVPPTGKGYNHQMGCGSVTKVMREKFADRFALGIIDKDKRQVEYLNEFTELINQGSLILHKHTARHHYIIQINPAVEAFILNNAKAAGISLDTYCLPLDLKLLMKLSKQTQNQIAHQRFKLVIKAIKRAGTDDFKKLALWVEQLRDKEYNVRIEDLK